MNLGWVSVHRKIQDHWLWADKPFSKGQAWVDMLLLANHADNKFLLGNELTEVQAGSFITSELKLMERWGWSKTKVRSFLDLLQKDEMIVKKTDRKKTTITLVNYGLFQDSETTEKPQKDRKKTTKRPQKDTNNNENNDNNENNNNTYKYSPIPELEKAIEEFVLFRKKVKKPLTEHGIELVIKKLSKLASSVDKQVAIINQSIEQGWTGLYELKEDKKKSGGRKEIVPQWMDKPKPNKFHNFDQREYDYDELEKKCIDKVNKQEQKELSPEYVARVKALKERCGAS